MSKWVSMWGIAHTDLTHLSPNYNNRTMRLSLRCNLKGCQLRVRVANAEGKKPMVISQASVHAESGATHPVHFEGKSNVILQPGQELFSDAVEMDLVPGDLVVISMAFQGSAFSGNGMDECVQCSKNGNFVDAVQFKTIHRNRSSCYHDLAPAIPAISSVEVLSDDEAYAVVCFGDSITAQAKWTRPLTEILYRKAPGKITLVNKGIVGNRLLNGPMMSVMSMYGRAGLERFPRDVLGESGVKVVIIEMGTNDIAMARNPKKPDWITAEKLESAFTELASTCHEKGIRVFCCTIPPRGGSTAYLKEAETERVRFNAWVRSTDIFDEIIDFDDLLKSTDDPSLLAFSYDCGDHLHISALGGERVAEDIAVKLLR